MLDTYAENVFSKNMNMMIPYYLMASYAYYEKDQPIFTDSFFDTLAMRIIDTWNDIEHYHKSLLSIDMLEAGTYAGKYPTIVQDATTSLMRNKNIS